MNEAIETAFEVRRRQFELAKRARMKVESAAIELNRMTPGVTPDRIAAIQKKATDRLAEALMLLSDLTQ